MTPKSWNSIREKRLSREAMGRVDKRADAQLEELTLRELRQDLEMTQAQVAEAAKMTQSELSRLEGRSNHRISTLRRYAEAMGADLEICFVFGKRRVKLTDLG
jgi:DNA-binding XRE family transcriptional regulator